MPATLDALTELDRQGFVLPPGADPEQFLASARRTLEWARGVREELIKTGQAVVLGEVFSAEQLVPDELMAECLEPAASAYGIRPSWAPAFFSNKLLPFFVGGATFFADGGEDFQMFFALREPFRRKRRWMIYDRTEIISHEACHVARAALAQDQFEEQTAYALSESALRRRFGNMFRGRWESAAILGGAFLLITGTAIELATGEPWFKWASAVPLAATTAFLAVRAVVTNRLYHRARRFLHAVFGDNVRAALFRCTDEEILSMAEAARQGRNAEDWLHTRRGKDLRWQIICSRFLPG